MSDLRVALIGAGVFGKNHARVISELSNVTLTAVVDPNEMAARALAECYGCPVFPNAQDVAGIAECAVVATPTITHEAVGSGRLQLGLDVLV